MLILVCDFDEKFIQSEIFLTFWEKEYLLEVTTISNKFFYFIALETWKLVMSSMSLGRFSSCHPIAKKVQPQSINGRHYLWSSICKKLIADTGP